ncbi:hypothetical protein FJ364_01870, partial [Candidatus Dependentiae bacterium]|nr:hypothetical protein [Candidatus Dependentiae bacterium]
MRLSFEFLTAALPYAELLVKHAHGIEHVRDATATWLEQDNEVSVAFDSREIKSNELFIALKGNVVDGHTFVQDALRVGAVAALISDKKVLETVPLDIWRKQLVIVVPDTLQAFIDLATAWRDQLTIPIIAITGSVGKTTTKEMMRSILGAAGMKATVSLKNQNTTIGLCYTILNITSTDQAAVCEVGISLRGEMASRIAI